MVYELECVKTSAVLCMYVYMRETHIDKFLPDVRPVVGIRVVGVHVLDGVEDALRVQCVVVLLDVVPHHHVEKLPADVVGRRQGFVRIYNCGWVN